MKIRQLEVKDAEKYLAYFKKLVELDPERVERPEDVSKITLEKEEQFIQKILDKQKDGNAIALILENELGEIVAEAEIERKERWIEQHVAEIRFGVIPNYETEIEQLISNVIQNSKNIGIEVLIYFHLESQKTGISVIKKFNFLEAGKIKRYYKRSNGEYVNRLYFSKNISN